MGMLVSVRRMKNVYSIVLVVIVRYGATARTRF